MKFLEKWKAKRITKTTNAMLNRIKPALKNYIDQWRLIECGNYINKPVLSRAMRYLAGFSSDEDFINRVHAGGITINNSAVEDPNMRLKSGLYIIHIPEFGDYRFSVI